MSGGQCRPSLLVALAALAAPRLRLPPSCGFPRPRAAMDVAARGADQGQSLTACALSRQCTALGLCPCHERSLPLVPIRLLRQGSGTGCPPWEARAVPAGVLRRTVELPERDRFRGPARSPRCELRAGWSVGSAGACGGASAAGAGCLWLWGLLYFAAVPQRPICTDPSRRQPATTVGTPNDQARVCPARRLPGSAELHGRTDTA